MFAPAKIARRRMKLEELLTKIEQIEDQASLTLSEYPRGLTVERQRLIIGIAKQIRGYLEDQLRAGERRPEQQTGETEDQHLYSAGSRQHST